MEDKYRQWPSKYKYFGDNYLYDVCYNVGNGLKTARKVDSRKLLSLIKQVEQVQKQGCGIIWYPLMNLSTIEIVAERLDRQDKGLM